MIFKIIFLLSYMYMIYLEGKKLLHHIDMYRLAMKLIKLGHKEVGLDLKDSVFKNITSNILALAFLVILLIVTIKDLSE